ncbi:MAG: SDR family oxidoreductase [Myxococcota bacterium]
MTGPADAFLVTGASRGIGRAIAERLLARGMRVGAVGRDERALRELAKSAPSQVVVMVGDLSLPDQRSEIARAARSTFGELLGVVLAAGVARHEPFSTLSEKSLRHTFEVNFFSPALLCRDLAPLVAKGGSLTMVSSTLATKPAPNTAAYAASKAALEALTRTMAIELAPHVRVNAVAPGIVDTAMVRDLRLEPGEVAPTGQALKERLEAQQQSMAELHPLGRLGNATEVARAVDYLIRSNWSTGTVLTLDGGLTL